MALAMASGAAIPCAANAATKYWDMDPANAGASTGTTAAGTWNTSNTNWNTDSNGAAGATLGTWSSGDIAVFSAAADATGVFTVTLSSTQTVGAINFQEGTVTISSGGTLTLNGVGGAIDVASGDATINSVLGGTVGLTKTGVGILILGGVSTYTGTTTVSGGTLEVATGGSAGGGAVSVTGGAVLDITGGSFSPTGGITLSGGTLQRSSTATFNWSGGNTMTINSGGKFNVTTDAAGDYTTPTGAIINVSGAGSQINHVDSGATGKRLLISGSTVNVTPGGNLTADGLFVTNAGGTLIVGGSPTSTLNVTNGLQVGGGGQLGTFTLSNGATATLGGFSATTVTSANSASDINIQTGADLITSGIVRIGNQAVSGQVATVDITGSGTTFTITGASTTTIGAASLSSTTINISSAAVFTTGTGSIAINPTATVNINGGTFTALGTVTSSGLVSVGSGGTLNIGNGGTSGSFSGNISNGGAVNFNRSDNLTYAGAISGAGSLTQSGAGTLTLNGVSNSYSGGTFIDDGTVLLGAANVLPSTGSIRVDGGTLDIAATSPTVGAVTLDGGTIIGSGTLNASSYDVQFGSISAILGGSNGLTKSTAALVTLSGANTYTGTTAVSAGTLFNGAANVVADSSVVSIAGSATWNLNGFTETVSAITGAGTVSLGSGTLSLNGSGTSSFTGADISGSGGVTKSGVGTQELSGSFNYTGPTRILGGTLKITTLRDGGSVSSIGKSNSTASNLVIDGGTLLWAGTSVTLNSTNRNFTLGAGGGTIDASGTSKMTVSGAMTNSATSGTQTLTLTGTNTGVNTLSGTIANGSGSTTAMVKNGAGTWALTAGNSFTGGVQINAGTMLIGVNNALGSSGGTVSLANGVTLASNSTSTRSPSYAWAVNGNITLGQASGGTGELTFFGGMNLGGVTRTITIANDSQVIAGTISNGGLNVNAAAGALDLTAANTFTGGLTLNSGTLRVGDSDALGPDNSPVTLAGGTTLASANSSDFFVTCAFALNGDITLGQAGGGTGLRLFGTFDLNGATRTISVANVESGIGAVISNGGLRTGTSGRLRLDGANTYDGATIVQGGGTLLVFTNGALGTIVGSTTVNSGGTLAFQGVGLNYATLEPISIAGAGVGGVGAINGSGGNVTFAGAITMSADSSIGSSSNTLGLSGVVSGAFNLTKVGSATVELTGANTYGGATNITAGTLRATSGVGIPASSNVTINNGIWEGSVNITRTLGSGAGQVQLTGGTSGFGARGAPVALNLGGTITWGSAAFSPTALTLNGSGADAAIELVNSINLNGSTRTVSVASTSSLASSTLSGVIFNGGINPAGLTKSGPLGSKLSLTGNNTYDGDTTISGGTLIVSSSNNLGSSTNGIVLSSSATLAVSNNLASGSRNVTVNSGAFATIDTGAFDVTVGNVDGAGNLKQLGTGRLIMNRARIGILTVNGSAKLAAIADPMSSTSVTPGVSNVNSLVAIGTAQVNLTNNRIITNDVQGTESSGIYSGVQGLVQSGKIFTDQALAGSNQTAIGVATAAEAKGLIGAATTLWSGQSIDSNDTLVMYTWAGDANLDGKVNADDYASIDLYSTIPGSDSWNHGDFNYNGVINADDYALIDNNVQNVNYVPYWTTDALRALESGGSPTAGLTSVPEPALGVVALVFLPAMRSRRPRRCKIRALM
jgi:autotransporter-associated beta strand protein